MGNNGKVGVSSDYKEMIANGSDFWSRVSALQKGLGYNWIEKSKETIESMTKKKYLSKPMGYFRVEPAT